MATGRLRQYELRGLIRRVSHGHRSGIRKVFLAQPGNEARRRCAGLQIVLLVLVRLRRLDCGRGALDNQTEDPSALAALNRARGRHPSRYPGGVMVPVQGNPPTPTFVHSVGAQLSAAPSGCRLWSALLTPG